MAQAELTTHEIGHEFGLGHTDLDAAQNPVLNIMNSNITIVPPDQWYFTAADVATLRNSLLGPHDQPNGLTP
jgi:hypothetical protein